MAGRVNLKVCLILLFLTAAFLISGRTAFADPNLVSHWMFDEGTGSIAYDSANDNDGSIIDAAWFDDPYRGMCLNFDGDYDYVLVGDKDDLEQQEFTLSFWARLNYPSESMQGGIAKGRIFWPASTYSYKIDFDSGFACSAVTNTSDTAFSTSGPIEDSSWHMWSMTVGGGTLTLYKDGAFVNSTGYTGTIDYTKYFNDFVIGASSNGKDAFDGKIDDVRFYNRDLSAGEIWQLYREGLWPKASYPNPNDEATGVDPNIVLSWSPGKDAASHDVYFGTSFDDVNVANTSSPEYKGNFDVNAFDPCGLELMTTYYWRIDEVNEPNIWKGDVWSFETDRPEIGLSATQFEFTAPQGGSNPEDQILGIFNNGAGTLSWQISEDCNWLYVEPDNGSSTGEVDNVTLSVDISGLAIGTYTCNLTISDGNAVNSPQTVNVILVKRPEIGLSATQFKFMAIEGGANPEDQILGISNNSAETLNWQISEDCSWLYVEPDNGSSTGETDDVNLSVDISGLQSWIYTCNLTVSDPCASNNPQTAVITLHVRDSDGILHVPSEYSTIQDALTVAGPNDDIWVAQGTYLPDRDAAHPSGTNNRDATFQLKNGVALYGGFPAGGGSWEDRDPNVYVTILSGNIGAAGNNRDNSFHVVTGSGTGSTAILDGFTITAGYEINEYSPFDRGAGMYNYSGSPTVTNCTFTGNSADSYGGGMYNESGSPTITNCTFTGNSAAYIAGGGMYNYSSSPTITNCTFSSNSAPNGMGGGIHCEHGSSPTITNCTFSENSASYRSSGGGISNFHSGPTLTNCIFKNNSSGYGGGISNFSESNPTITNCTLSENSAYYFGGGMYNYGDNPLVTNCILWGNTAPSGPQIYNDHYSTPSITFSNIQGGYSGTGNINADPCFIDANNPDPNLRNYHLLASSPCINTGDPNYTPEPNETDIDGESRVMLGRVDMGADEFNPFEIDFNIVDKRRIGRTLFEYDCNVTLTNISLFTVSNVQLEIVKASENIVLIDPNVTFGALEIGPAESAISLDMCSFQVDRSEPAKIMWQSDYEIVDGVLEVQDIASGACFLNLAIIGGDINGDDKVDLDDLEILVDQWLQPPGTPSADIVPPPEGDNIVDFLDFALLAKYWLRGIGE